MLIEARSRRTSPVRWLRIRYVATSVLFGLVSLFAQLPAAHAHAVLVSSTPAAKGSVAGPNVSVELRVKVRVDGTRSRLVLVTPGPDAQPQTLKIEKQASAAVLTTQATGLKPGSYSIRWQVLASDGHITRGEVPFTVSGS